MKHLSTFAVCFLLCGPANRAWSEPDREAENAGDSAARIARQVDDLLEEEVFGQRGEKPLPLVDDYTFMRRVFFDAVGHPPTPEEITRFVQDTARDKRGTIIDTLLANPWYGDNWARYWRDVILFRRSEDRALLAARAVTDFLSEKLNENASWDEIARGFITAEGDVRAQGQTALIMAQNGRPEETVAEISRIFLGIQIQCAQCHDHPYDRWERAQFHELAAFFPRVAVRPNRAGDQRTFLVVSHDQPLLRRRPNNNNRFRGTPEHRMPDLNDPQTPGTVMTPTFFVTGKSLALGTSDAERRESLASWITAPDNPWFARALVNRLWAELLGTGFYEPVDDLGPDHDCQAPRTLDFLSAAFVDSGYDLKRLLAAIMRTDAYQRESRSRDIAHDQNFLVNHPQRLRADQLFNALTAATQLKLPSSARVGRNRLNRDPRLFFAQFFGFDPSLPREEVSSSVPQALQLMNSPLIERMIDARRPAGLGRLLYEISSDEDLVTELYLRCYARPPARNELKQVLQHVRRSETRGDGFEDVLWALINSSEFRYRS